MTFTELRKEIVKRAKQDGADIKVEDVTVVFNTLKDIIVDVALEEKICIPSLFTIQSSERKERRGNIKGVEWVKPACKTLVIQPAERLTKTIEGQSNPELKEKYERQELHRKLVQLNHDDAELKAEKE